MVIELEEAGSGLDFLEESLVEETEEGEEERRRERRRRERRISS